MHIPTGSEALTAEWLTAALYPEARASDFTVNSFQAAPLAESQGFFGQIVRVHLTYEGAATGAPRSLIAKFSSATPEMRKRSVDSYEREVRFYQQLARLTELPTPICYYADINIQTGDHILLLQDLAPMHSGSRAGGCTPEQARLAIRNIAKLHTTWWGRTKSAELGWLVDNDTNLDAEIMRQAYDQWWPHFYQRAKAQLPTELSAFSEQLGRHRATLRKHSFGSQPRTLIHRDFQLDNLFFGSGEEEGGEEGGLPFAIVDWQFLSRGRGIWDVAYFLSESLLPADRRSVEMELLTSYYQSLMDHGIHNYPFAQCLDDYRLCLLQRHTALVSTIAAMPFSEEQRDMHINILLPRNIAAILDHQAHKVQLE